MNYYRPQQHSQRWARRLTLITVLAVSVFILDLVSGGIVRRPLWYAETLWRDTVARSLSELSSTGIFASSARLSDENAALREEVVRYRSLALSAGALQQQNAALARTARLALVRPGVTAPIVSSESSIGTFLVGAGRQDGVTAGDLIRSDDGFAIGLVETVQETTALCRSVFAPRAMIEATVGQAHIQLEGRGGSNGRGKAPRDAAIAIGDVVTSASMRGYPIGQVGQIEQDSAGAFQEIYVRFPQDISAMRYVYIERP